MINANDLNEEQNELEFWQIQQLEKMVEQSYFDEERRFELMREIANMEAGDYDDLYFRLSINQRDRVSCGDPYSITDIKYHLKRLR